MCIVALTPINLTGIYCSVAQEQCEFQNKCVLLVIRERVKNCPYLCLFWQGHLVGICGVVGSGKTSLLLAALGQLHLLKGHVTRDGLCAYVSQEAWVLNATLRENILFGETFDAKRQVERFFRGQSRHSNSENWQFLIF